MTVRRTQTADRLPVPCEMVDARTVRLLPAGQPLRQLRFRNFSNLVSPENFHLQCASLSISLEYS